MHIAYFGKLSNKELEFLHNSKLLLIGPAESVKVLASMKFCDFIREPWTTEELYFRINKAFKQYSEYTLYPLQNSSSFNIFLSSLKHEELIIFNILFNNINQLVKRSILLMGLWGENNKKTRIIDVHISNIRKKLKAVNTLEIISARGKGYRMVDNQKACG